MMDYVGQKPIELILQSRDRRIVSTLLDRNVDIPIVMRNLSPVRTARVNFCVPVGIHIEQPVISVVEDQPENEG